MTLLDLLVRTRPWDDMSAAFLLGLCINVQGDILRKYFPTWSSLKRTNVLGVPVWIAFGIRAISTSAFPLMLWAAFVAIATYWFARRELARSRAEYERCLRALEDEGEVH